MEAKNRESKTIDAINLLASATASNRYTYSNLSGTVALIMSELVISNKNLVDSLKENTRLERVLGQFHHRASTTGGSRATGRSGTPQQKKGVHYLWSCKYYWGCPSFKCTAKLTGHGMHYSAAITN